MTWLLTKLGLQASGTLIPLAAFIAACVAAVGMLVYIAHTLTASGYEKAVAECAARDVAHAADMREQQQQRQEDSREVIIKYTAATAIAKAAVVTEKAEVANDIKTNPAPVGCALSAHGLVMWNRPLATENRIPDVPGRSDPAIPDRSSPAQPARRLGWGFGFATPKPDGIETSLQRSAPGLDSAQRAGEAVPAPRQTTK